MKRGDKVAVCYDGKWGRRVQGEVIKQHNGHHITVRFELGEFRFRAIKRHGFKYFGGWVRHEDALMPKLFGMPGDWYSVFKWREK